MDASCQDYLLHAVVMIHNSLVKLFSRNSLTSLIHFVYNCCLQWMIIGSYALLWHHQHRASHHRPIEGIHYDIIHKGISWGPRGLYDMTSSTPGISQHRPKPRVIYCRWGENMYIIHGQPFWSPLCCWGRPIDIISIWVINPHAYGYLTPWEAFQLQVNLQYPVWIHQVTWCVGCICSCVSCKCYLDYASH